jgi:hypothetical protein
VTLIPPLQLAQADPGYPRDIAAGEITRLGNGHGNFYFCFEHFTMPLSGGESPGFYQIVNISVGQCDPGRPNCCRATDLYSQPV